MPTGARRGLPLRVAPRVRWRGAVRASALVLVTLVGVACDASGTPAPLPELSAPPGWLAPESSEAPSDPYEGAVLDAYQAYWRTVQEAARTGRWQAAQLATVAEGPALDQLSRRLYAWQRNAITMQGGLRLAPVVEEHGPQRAVVRDCLDASTWIPAVRGRAVPATGTSTVFATLGRRDGRWRVVGVVVRGTGCSFH